MVIDGNVERDVVGSSDCSHEFVVDCCRALDEPRLMTGRPVEVDAAVAQRGEVKAIFGADDVVCDEVLPRVGRRGRSKGRRAEQLINFVVEVRLCRRRNHYIQRGCNASSTTSKYWADKYRNTGNKEPSNDLLWFEDKLDSMR